MRNVAELPKLELHRHLEGSIRPETYFELAREQHLPLLEPTLEQLLPRIQYRPGDERSLPAFLRKLQPTRNIFTNPEVLARVTFEAFEDAAHSGAIYAEIRFSASHMFLRGMKEEEIAQGLWEGLRTARQRLGMDGCLIAGITRELGGEMAERVTRFALKYSHKGILGMDLFGNEEIPPGQFQPFFDRAKEAGLGITIHAGEGGGPEHIRTAIEQLHATRIGHGVHVVWDPQVMELVRDMGVLLEMCPTSNVQTGAVPRLEDHPLRQVLDYGIQACVSSDDPQFSDTTLEREYEIAHTVLGVPLADLHRSTCQAVQHIFERERIRALEERLRADGE